MPPDGVQRGTLMTMDGDLLTPLYPSKADLYGARTIKESNLPIVYTRAAAGFCFSASVFRPKECAMDGTMAEHVYPSTVWMPPDGVQRGTLMTMDGDLLTPLYPSKADLYGARTIKEAKKTGMLPDIPVLPLSYSDAYQLLSRLGGQKVPVEWVGGLNITYKTGPGFTDHEKSRVRVTVHASTEIKEIRNLIGYIYGAKEPDEYVMLGNHYDAWVYGSIDPNRDWLEACRSLVFCAWDAEEYGLIGSTEFVEEFANIINDRTIVYLNVDLISDNSTLNADTIPSMYQAVVDTAKKFLTQ
uniref:Peptidase M28 domain-containing protein n=1 Tax=Ditylenchus dipsaci TaxID=166011 RepID=A0A915DYS7_9BILA